jgi:hypothetical protein
MRNFKLTLLSLLVCCAAFAKNDESSILTKGDDKLSLQGVAEIEIPEKCFKEKIKITLSKTSTQETMEDYNITHEGKDRIPYEIRINTGKIPPSCAFKLKMNVPAEFTKKSADKNAEPALLGQEFIRNDSETYDTFQTVTADFNTKQESLSADISTKLFTNERTKDNTYEAILLVSQDEKFTPPQQDILPLSESNISISTFIIPDAQFERQDFTAATTADEKRNDLPVTFHRIAAGKGTILALRMFDPMDTNTVDDELFEKITIWSEQFKPGTYSFGKDKLTAYYTRGASAWSKTQCGYVLDNGSLTISEGKDGKMQIAISTEVKCDQAPKKISKSYTAKKISVKQITPWIGKKGEHIYDETYIKPGAM